MGMRISTNVSSIQAQRTMIGSQREIGRTFAQLSSGSRITKAADDAAGLAISEKLKSQVRSLTQASRNANDGISLVQVAEGGMNEISNILTRVRELGIQAASDTVGDQERGYIDNEVQQLFKEIDRISQTTRFGQDSLLNGDGKLYEVQVGTENDSFADRIAFDNTQLNTTTDALALSGVEFTSKENAQNAIQTLDQAQSRIAAQRSTLGALQNRFQSTIENLGAQNENLSAANSRIRDADIANSSAELAKNNILLQASNSVLAQANQMPNMALKLIG